MDTRQVDLFPFTGEELKQAGIKAAIEHADRIDPTWSETAFEILRIYALHEKQFMAEDIRNYAEAAGFEVPPSNRAWGSVFLRAKREGIIGWIGIKQVKNPKAHQANASYWQSNIV